MKIVKLLSVGLLISVFNVPAFFAGEDEVVRVGEGIFHYMAPENKSTKEVCFAIADGVKAIHGFTCQFLTCLYNGRISTVADYDAPFERNFAEYINAQGGKVNGCLNLAPGLDQGHVMSFFDGICQQIFAVYQPFFQRVDALNKLFKENPISDPSCEGTYLLFPGDIGTVMITKGREAVQCDMLQELSNLQSEITRARALASCMERLDNSQLILYLAKVRQINFGDRFCVVNPAVYGLYEACCNAAPKSREILALQQNAAVFLKLPSVRIPGQIASLELHLSEGVYEATAQGYEDTEITKEHILAELKRIAPETREVPKPPKFITMFTEKDEAILREIVATDEKIQSALRDTGKTPAGWSKDEAIMDYGTMDGKTSITPEVRQGISDLLRDQLARRGITPKPLKDAVFESRLGRITAERAVLESLKDWAKTLNIQDVGNVSESLDYIFEKMQLSAENSRFFDVLWTLHGVHSAYSKWPKDVEKRGFLEAIHPLLFQSFTHVGAHLGKCGTGARGRTFLVELGMLNFFKDYHPRLEVTA